MRLDYASQRTMSNLTAIEDQPKYYCFGFITISDHYKELCGLNTIQCITIVVIAAMVLASTCYFLSKVFKNYAAALQAEAAFLQEIAEIMQQAQLEELELALEAKPDPPDHLSDLTENLNKINFCHETREILFPKEILVYTIKPYRQ